MGKHKHKSKSSKKRKHKSSSSEEKDLPDFEVEKKSHRHHKKHHKEKKKHKRKSESLELSDDDGPTPAKVIRVSSSSRSSFSLSPENVASRNYTEDVSEDDFPFEKTSVETVPSIKQAVDVDAIRKKLEGKKKTTDSKIESRRKYADFSEEDASFPYKSSTKSSVQGTTPGSPPKTSYSGDTSSMSIEETNKLRLKLGLKPLDVSSSSSKPSDSSKNSNEPEKILAKDTGEEFVHKPAKNMSELKQTEKIAAKLKERKEKRELETRLLKVKKLADSDSDDDVKKWVSKSRKLQTEKELAEKKAKELDAMDEVFGIGDLIDEEIKSEKSKVYSAKHIKGLKVEHDIKDFTEGRNVILTLKDQDILAEDASDTLVNVNMVDDERHKKNVLNRKQKVGGKFGYSALDEDEFDEDGNPRESQLLSKYDEEIEGTKKKSFAIGENYEEQRKNEVREKLYGNRKLESLASAKLKLASDYLTEDEVKFKKPKKKVRKIRKTKLRADDLLNMDSGADQSSEMMKREVKSEPESPYRRSGSARVKDEPEDDDDRMELDVDDMEAPGEDLSEIKMLEMDDGELQVALNKARKLKQRENICETSVDKVAKSILAEADLKNEAGGAIILNSTAEFCRTLGDIPTYGQAGNRGEEEQELLDFEREMKEEREREEQSKLGGWNEVQMESAPGSSVSLPLEAPILEAEPDLGRGLAGALNLAVSKGYLEKETLKRPSASRFAHLQAQNYSIDDKAHQDDDKFGRRERYSGPTSEFKEKEGYKPNIQLDYIDDEGHLLSSKEAFRYLSHKFHGKGPSKNKIEKRLKKQEQQALMKQMSSTDTPLGTLNMLQSKQKQTQSPFIVLSGSKQLQAPSLTKTK
ncbi:U4/U6.U5 tri-snRNP-associated protein 1 [Diaphorina citri]|uniref:U4/U6.U5 tri-snRNP-associated protein 1 n=1 Tax=Diaphorina citri TaxID=121845 RepID=A0A3Q0JGL8_DIACI|nr:U4/U6.U5 tri-snRNP-associated protein 1 [Diaphorina citri]XP_026685826.1 U4/U6.U5 tri-snRNP-associated protein 1 [Diaphorina citri]